MKKTLQLMLYEEQIYFSLFKMWDCVENEVFDGAMYFQLLYLSYKSQLRSRLSKKTFVQRMKLAQIALFGNILDGNPKEY